MPRNKVINIDEQLDFEFTEFFMKNIQLSQNKAYQIYMSKKLILVTPQFFNSEYLKRI